jgi:hypothetical protein
MGWSDFIENVRTPGFLEGAVKEFNQINNELLEDLSDVFRNEGVEVVDAVGEAFGKTCVAATTGTMDAYNDPIEEPLPGTPVYCLFEKGKTRAGIHVGGDNIIYYDQFGFIEVTDILTFATDTDTLAQQKYIYCCCDGDDSKGSTEVLGRAMKYDNEICLDAFKNSYDFVWYALTGEITEEEKSLNDIKSYMIGNKIEWRPWHYSPLNSDEKYEESDEVIELEIIDAQLLKE